ncbi:MAG: hypothetical protein AB7S75_10455 [Desulfococcaceae bacterium]
MKKMFFLVFSLCFAASAWADTVILKSGKQYECRRAWKENGEVKMEKFGGVLSFPEAEVSEIIFSEKEPPPSAPKPKPAYTPPKDTVPYPYWQLQEVLGVTKAGFQKIRPGMEYVEVSHILGEAGEEVSRSDLGGITTVMYMWKAKDYPITGGNMNATFQDDRLVSKAQSQLR